MFLDSRIVEWDSERPFETENIRLGLCFGVQCALVIFPSGVAVAGLLRAYTQHRSILAASCVRGAEGAYATKDGYGCCSSQRIRGGARGHKVDFVITI